MDADDGLDELLDEVEEKFCRHVSVASSARGHAGTREDTGQKRHNRGFSATKPTEQKNSISEDIDALLEDLLDVEQCGDSSRLKREQILVEEKPSSQSGWRRCCPVFIGGSSLTNGVGTATTKRSCDQLRCVSCDFRVLMFDDCEWDASCDYLFFRNNSPDRQKLRAKLKKRRGFRAYACQCSWFSSSSPELTDLTDLRLQPQLRWVCGKHHD